MAEGHLVYVHPEVAFCRSEMSGPIGRKISCSLVNPGFMRNMRLFLGAVETLNQTERHARKERPHV